MNIDIFYSPSERKIECVSVEVAEHTPLQDALPSNLSSMANAQNLSFAVWGRAVPTDYKLQAGDRIELLRDLRVDPKTARRERFASQGIKKAGLFKTKRAGAKAGY